MRICLLLFCLTLLGPSLSYGNGILWSLGLQGSTPGPLKQNILYLSEEIVTIHIDSEDGSTDNRVVAEFYVINPSDKDIKTTMGFPINITYESYKNNPYDEKDTSYRNGIASVINTSTKIFVNGEISKFTLNEPTGNGYEYVINWEMAYPANKTTKFVVEYPIIGATYGGGEGVSYNYVTKWGYITHTGSFWAKPIEKAKFSICGTLIENYLSEKNGVEFIYDEGFFESKSIQISPDFKKEDNKANCVVLIKNNWVPTTDDDIQISLFAEGGHK